MSIELYYSPHCDACADPRRFLSGQREKVVLKDVTKNISEAVALGIVQPPALVIEGQLIAQGPAALQRLAKLMEEK